MIPSNIRALLLCPYIFLFEKIVLLKFCQKIFVNQKKLKQEKITANIFNCDFNTFIKNLLFKNYLTIWNKIATTRNNVATISVNFSIPSFSSSKMLAELFAKPWLLSGCSKITLIMMIDKITRAIINKFSNTLLVPPIIYKTRE